MPDFDPAREFSTSGTSEPKRHPPNVFVAPSSSHHPLPSFVAGGAKVSDWSAILDELPYGLVVLGPRQELRHENQACRRLTGLGIEESGGVEKWLEELCPDPEHREKVIRSWREEIWRNQLTRTFTLRTADQKPKEIEFRSSLLRDGGITLTLDDVTERRRAEETSRHGKLRFRALFTHTREGVLLTDRTGRVIDANPAFLKLVGRSQKEVRMSSLGELIQSEPEAANEEGASGATEVQLQTAQGPRRVRKTDCPVGEADEPSLMSVHLIEPISEDEVQTERIRARLKTVARKAQALLNAVPDLILLINEDGSLADFAPPPTPWPELEIADSWRGRPLAETWPALNDLWEQCRQKVQEGMGTVQAGLREKSDKGFAFSATFASCGDGQMLVVVRNRGEEDGPREQDSWEKSAVVHAPLGILRLDAEGRPIAANPAAITLLGEAALSGDSPRLDTASLPDGVVAEFVALEQDQDSGSLVFLRETAEAIASDPAPELTAKAALERHQHSFRNHLQLVTSLFSLEPQGEAAREAFFKWQVRLRSLALSCPRDPSGSLWLTALLRDLADEVCSLAGRGPGRREVVVSGEESLEVVASRAPALCLLVGELMRAILATPQFGPGPALYVEVGPLADGGFRLLLRAGAKRVFTFGDRDSELETLELLAAQLQGRLESAGEFVQEWTLVVPRRPY